MKDILISHNQLHHAKELKIMLGKKLDIKYLDAAKMIIRMKIKIGKSDRKLLLF